MSTMPARARMPPKAKSDYAVNEDNNIFEDYSGAKLESHRIAQKQNLNTVSFSSKISHTSLV